MNPEPTPAAQVWAELLAFVTGQDRLRALRLELDLGVGKAELLIKLAEAPMTLREIAQAAEVDPSAATVAVDRLERRGLAERRANPGDKRSRLVHLTEAGLQAAATARRILTEPPPALAALEAEDLAALARIFATLNAGPPGKDGGGRPR
ncbi:MarR family transcriptional regulator [Amycolatopsis sp. NPDC049688]|uniref:MarR family winged helix-turn-helix transcriptional regulator n=1 Tax=Amycolatopsis sp. NPDC049688 TaxID=3154733 RepID=UPI003445DE6B